MHEWALAESILAAAIDAANKDNLKKISEIIIQIGELQQIERDIFNFALHEIIKTQKLLIRDATIRIDIEKSTLKCKNCGHTWNFNEMKKKINDEEAEAIHFIPEVTFVHTRCPHCRSPDFVIETGRGVSIKSIKGFR